MDDFLVVDVDEALDEVVEVVLQLRFCDALALFHHLVEGVVRAELEHNVDVLAVLEDVVEQQDVLMFQGFVDFNFSDELNRRMGTFCLALFFFKVYLETILMADIFLLYTF